jgi:hypothetical protein
MAVAWRDDLPGGGSLIRVSVDGGATWCPPYRVANGIAIVRALGVIETTIHVAWDELVGGPTGDWRVFYRRGVLLPTEVEERATLSLPLVSLSQNYPNPFNPKTKIVYRVGSRESVSLRLFDVLGREVATLVNGAREAGTHEATWDATGRPSGVYYYRLVVQSPINGARIFTKKMILIQ